MRLAFLVFTALFAAAPPALADAIDGDWCGLGGGHLRIEGPQIELSPGRVVEGTYTRHAFSYVAPENDPEAGTRIQFVLRSEEEMRRVRQPDVKPEHEDIWRRCASTS